MKKIAFTSSGSVLIRENGITRKASSKEIGEYLKTIVPSKKNGAFLKAVKYNNGYVYAKYDNGKVFKKVLAQSNNAVQQEPINFEDKTKPSLNTPRSKKHSQPQTKEITKNRPDLKNPIEIRKDKYDRGGDNGADEHNNQIPRSKNNSGLSGRKKTTFDKEKANDSTSGNPDNYTQKLHIQKKPTSTKDDDNHVSSANTKDGLKVDPSSVIYQKITIAKNKKDENKDKKPLPPWLKKKDNSKEDKKGGNKKDKKDDGKTDKKQAKMLEQGRLKQIAEQKETIEALRKEAARYRVRESRQKAALKLALAFKESNPQQFPTIESIVDKTMALCKQMNSEALNSTYEQVEAIRIANSKKSDIVKTASVNKFEGISTAFSSPIESISQFNSFDNRIESLKKALMGETALGKEIAKFDSYQESLGD